MPGKVLIVDGYSEIGEHVGSAIVNLICLRHSLSSRAVANLKSVSEKSCFRSHLSNININTMDDKAANPSIKMK